MAFDESLSSSVLSLESLFSNNRFVPAGIQRSYQWGKPEVESLLQDLQGAVVAARNGQSNSSDIDSEDTPKASQANRDVESAEQQPAPMIYFLGQIVASRNEEGVLEIYDGLQRLTTLTILVCVLRDLIRNKTFQRQLHELVVDLESLPRLSYLAPDKTLEQEIQKPGETRHIRRHKTRSNLGKQLREVTRTLRSNITDMDHDDRIELVEYLLRRSPVSLLIVENRAVARQIFIATNIRGKSLKAEDLFKGQLCDLAKTSAEESIVEEAYSQLHSKLGNSFSLFMRAVDLIERRQPSGEAYLSDLADFLATKIKKKNENITRWMGDLGQYKGAWDDLEAALGDPKNDPTGGHIWRLRLVKWHEWRAPALKWLDEYRKNLSKKQINKKQQRDILTRRMARLQRTAIAMTIAEMTKADRTAIIVRALRPSDSRRQTGEMALLLNPKFRGRAAYRLGEHGIRPAAGQVIVRWWESVLWSNKLKSRHLDIAEASLEHVLPQNPGPDWYAAFPDRREREACITMIGNLVALDKVSNTQLENSKFDAKRIFFRKARSQYRTLDDVSKETEWTAETVRKRSQKLAALIWTELDLPDVPDDELSQLAAQTAADAEHGHSSEVSDTDKA